MFFFLTGFSLSQKSCVLQAALQAHAKNVFRILRAQRLEAVGQAAETNRFSAIPAKLVSSVLIILAAVCRMNLSGKKRRPLS